MKTHTLSLMMCAVLAACGDAATDADEASVPTENPAVTAETPVEVAPSRFVTAAEAREVILAETATQSDRMEALDAFGELAELGELRTLSTALWSGADVTRDRAASSRIALAAFERQPQSWSALRGGIALVNGLGMDADPARAVEVLGHESLATHMAAPYYQSKAYQAMGDMARARETMALSAERGNARAAEELEDL